MLRAPRSMPNSSGGTPITFASASLRVVTMVTSWVVGAASSAGAVGGSGGMIMFMGSRLKKWLEAIGATAAHVARNYPLPVSAAGIVAQIVLKKTDQPAGRRDIWI